MSGTQHQRVFDLLSDCWQRLLNWIFPPIEKFLIRVLVCTGCTLLAGPFLLTVFLTSFAWYQQEAPRPNGLLDEILAETSKDPNPITITAGSILITLGLYLFWFMRPAFYLGMNPLQGSTNLFFGETRFEKNASFGLVTTISVLMNETVSVYALDLRYMAKGCLCRLREGHALIDTVRHDIGEQDKVIHWERGEAPILKFSANFEPPVLNMTPDKCSKGQLVLMIRYKRAGSNNIEEREFYFDYNDNTGEVRRTLFKQDPPFFTDEHLKNLAHKNLISEGEYKVLMEVPASHRYMAAVTRTSTVKYGIEIELGEKLKQIYRKRSWKSS